MLVKICGLRRIEDIEYVNVLKPDFIGFIFALNKVRTIDIYTARKLKDRLNPSINECCRSFGMYSNHNCFIRMHGQF